jgi:hypothetical protein
MPILVFHCAHRSIRRSVTSILRRTSGTVQDMSIRRGFCLQLDLDRTTRLNESRKLANCARFPTHPFKVYRHDLRRHSDRAANGLHRVVLRSHRRSCFTTRRKLTAGDGVGVETDSWKATTTLVPCIGTMNRWPSLARRKAPINRTHSRRFARFGHARLSRSVWSACVFSAAFLSGPGRIYALDH